MRILLLLACAFIMEFVLLELLEWVSSVWWVNVIVASTITGAMVGVVLRRERRRSDASSGGRWVH